MIKSVSGKNLVLESVLRVLKVYFVFALIMVLFRTIFIFYFGPENLNSFMSDISLSYFFGWRYDTIVILYFMFPIYFLLCLASFLKSPFLFNWFQFFSKLHYIIIALIIPFILICDLGFYSFFQDHINILFYGLLEDDTAALLESIWKNYPIEWILIGFSLYSLFQVWISVKIFKRVHKKEIERKSRKVKSTIFFLLSLIGYIGGIRGGYGEFVLAPQYSDFSEHEFFNQAALNGIIALEKTIRLRESRNSADFDMAHEMGYGKGIEGAFEDYLGVPIAKTPKSQLVNLIHRKTSFNQHLESNKVNVIVFVMESFGSSWLDYHSEKFNLLGNLEKHFKEDYLFSNFISSENGTIGSLLTIGTNIPPRPGKRFLSESKFLQLPLESAAHIPYKKNGYETFFVYGGKLGWRDIGKYFKVQNYDHLVGENKIKEELQLTGKIGTEWGLYDEHFFNFVYGELEKSSTPKFFLSLSTSNHPPFEVPKGYEIKSLEIPDNLKNRVSREKDLFQKRFEAFQYANDKLGEFIQKIKTGPFAENTVIAVTGDHNFWGFMNYTSSEIFTKYKVPFYIYLPKKLRIKKYNSEKLGSHEDVMTTLYNLSLSEVEYLSFGDDLFSLSESFAINGTIQASQNGVLYKKNPYSWKQIPFVNKKMDSDKGLESLSRRFRSSVTISDFYLEQSFKGKN